jgi:uncharacterized membrane protein YsdA (DUF1294 family)/cold shock CspA family protein
MRHQGKITNWKDEKGFGFITPNGRGKQVFVHIKSFSNRERRPTDNDVVTYDLEIAADGRTQAKRVAFLGEQVASRPRSSQSNIPLLLASFFLAFVAALVLVGKLPNIVLWLYLIASSIAYLTYAIDKSAAKNDRWRTQESTLHLFALVGGWPGAIAAQRLLRHKSSKQSFQIVFWLTVVLNCSALVWLLSSSGSEMIRSALGASQGLGQIFNVLFSWNSGH